MGQWQWLNQTLWDIVSSIEDKPNILKLILNSTKNVAHKLIANIATMARGAYHPYYLIKWWMGQLLHMLEWS